MKRGLIQRHRFDPLTTLLAILVPVTFLGLGYPLANLAHGCARPNIRAWERIRNAHDGTNGDGEISPQEDQRFIEEFRKRSNYSFFLPPIRAKDSNGRGFQAMKFLKL